MMKQIFCLLLTFGLVVVETHFKQVAYANPAFVIQGNIIRSDNTSPGPLTVSLMEITMSDRPAIKPVSQVKSDPAGRYQLTYAPEGAVTKNVFYRISVDYAGQTIGSDPFRINQTKQSLTIDLTLPAVKTGSQHLEIPKEVVIIESMEEKIRLTTILYFVNAATVLVDAKKIPFEKPIPDLAYNIQSLGSQDGLDFKTAPGKVLIGLAMAEGTKQVFFSYDLPIKNGRVEMDYPLMPGIQEVEFTTPEKNTILQVGDQSDLDYTITDRQKKMGSRVFYSKILLPQSAGTSIPLAISGLPLGQSRLIVPALVLFVTLISGLAIYLVRSAKIRALE